MHNRQVVTHGNQGHEPINPKTTYLDIYIQPAKIPHVLQDPTIIELRKIKPLNSSRVSDCATTTPSIDRKPLNLSTIPRIIVKVKHLESTRLPRIQRHLRHIKSNRPIRAKWLVQRRATTRVNNRFHVNVDAEITRLIRYRSG